MIRLACGDRVIRHQLQRLDQRRMIEIGHAIGSTHLHELRGGGRLRQRHAQRPRAGQREAQVF